MIASIPARALIAAALVTTALSGCGQSAPTDSLGGTPASAAPNPCGVFAPTTTSTLPTAIGQSQIQVDCAAWQAFIALNWQADPNRRGYPDSAATWADFGKPGVAAPSVWESYLEAAQVFGGPPPTRAMWQTKPNALKQLQRTSKFGSIDLTDITQAGGGHHWLTSQRGDITYYEISMNEDEFDFITQPGFDLTSAAGQLACATQPGRPVSDGPPPIPPTAPRRGGFNLPVGMANGWDDTDCTGKVASFGQGVGAIEIKAAWTPLPADGSLDYRYKTARAEITDPVTKATKQVTVGLVGLHIIRKRFPKMPWVWATFEHIDNSPDEAAGGGFTAPVLPANPNRKASPGYTFFNPACTPSTDPTYQCRHNAPPTRCGTSAIKCDPYDKPMQVTRLRPVGTTANSVTAYVWGLVPPKSVFNYYRLIDVQWPQAPLGTPPGPGLKTPLTNGNPKPAGNTGGTAQIVANTTMETFQQAKNACLDCHVFASIAQAPGTPGKQSRMSATVGSAPAYASDYSFMFIAETRR